MLTLILLIFLTLSLVFCSLYFFFVPSQTKKRLAHISLTDNKAEWLQKVALIVSPFANFSTPDENWETSPLRMRFIHAGFRHTDAYWVFFGFKTLLPLFFAFCTFVFLELYFKLSGTTYALYLVLSALVGVYAPNWVLNATIHHRQRELLHNFPDAVDLLLVCVESGQGLDASLNKVAEEMQLSSSLLSEELQLTNLEIRAGAPREVAMKNLAYRTGIKEISSFAIMLSQADKLGSSIGESLRQYSDDLRYKRQVIAEEIAAKTSTKMMVPLVFCIFPSLLVVILGPAIIQIMRTLSPMTAGIN